MGCIKCKKNKRNLLESDVGYICANCMYKKNFYRLKGKGLKAFIKYNWNYLEEKILEYI
ncbi:hypothetical protein KLN56_10855 [Clostridioides difficile]|nr:hypothetical protein [Clostridioides difficile]MCC0642230.1 hypothetical protein [Clostridioides sp. ES-S-0049-03]EIS9524058.1 hypothetical protein [Clostridioides difficile]EIS9625635.1 hypothetical protein [Clostridioides difficile]MBY2508792.1 hypothetical protein [Clostridioides difficile]MDM9773617.1 hypothetical protein [Clostridioides difficile]